MKIFQRLAVFLVLLYGLKAIKTSLRAGPCEHNKLIINYAKDCAADNVITVSNVSASLDENCHLVMLGCGVVKSDINTVNLHYDMKKGPFIRMQGNLDLCDKVKTIDNKYIDILKGYGIATSCPISPRTTCLSNTTHYIDLSPYKNQIAMIVGEPVTIKLNFDFGEGGNTCFETKFTIY